MLDLPAGLAEHLALDVTTLTVCWAISRHDGVVVRGTAHDRDVTIDSGPYAGTYRARSAAFATDVRLTSDGSVSNVDTEGALRVDAEVDDLTVEQVEAGVYDQAPAVLLMLSWADPNAGHKVLLAGTVGEFMRDSDGRYRTEVRGLAQALQQQIVQTYSERCNVRLFGDQRCKFDVPSATRTGTITAVTSRKRFQAALNAGPPILSPVYYNGGRLEWTSGANNGFVREVRFCVTDEDDYGNDIVDILLHDEAPDDVEIGDTFELPPGCDRTALTCRHVHDNLVNFRGYGLFAVGRDRLMRGPGTGQVESLIDADTAAALLEEQEAAMRSLMGGDP